MTCRIIFSTRNQLKTPKSNQNSQNQKSRKISKCIWLLILGGGEVPAPSPGIGKGFVHQKMERSKTSFEWLCGPIWAPKGVQWSQKALVWMSGGGIFCSKSEIFGLYYGLIIRFLNETHFKIIWILSKCVPYTVFWMQLHFFAIFMLPVATFSDFGTKPSPYSWMKKCFENALWKRACRPIEPSIAQIASKAAQMVLNGAKRVPEMCQKHVKNTTSSFQKPW